MDLTTNAPRYCEVGFHAWERELRVTQAEERVVRTCRHCGAAEVCWRRARAESPQEPARAGLPK